MRERLARLTGGAPLYPLLVLFGLNAVDELDRTAFGVLVPNIRDHFGLSVRGILAVVALAGVAALVLELPIAWWADRWSRVRIAAAGAVAWGGFSLLTGLAPSLTVLAAARAGAGIGRAVNTPTHNALLADYYDVTVRTKVYGVHRSANAVGQFLGAALGGLLASWFSWRVPFIAFVAPTALLVLLALRLREPVRGAHERRALGASEEAALTAEPPPSLGEAWQILWQVRTLRRICYSLPFLAAAVVGLGALFSLYYREAFGLNEAQRGFVAAFAEPAQLAGLLVGIPFASRLALRDPGLVLRFLSVLGAGAGAGFVALAFAPSLGVAVGVHVLLTALLATVVPGIFAALSLAIPPRARALGFSVGSLWVMPGLLVLPLVGALADQMGVRRGMLVLVPVFVLGAWILSSAATFVSADVRNARLASLARAEVLASRRRGEGKLLLVRGLEVAYDGVQVLFGVDLELGEGELVALLGTNGAGKSTLLKAIAGAVTPTAGAVFFDGRDITYLEAHESARQGIVLVPGGRGVLPGLTVAENLTLAGWLYRKDPAYLRTATEEALELFPILRERWSERAGTLSGGEQQMLTLAQALISRPRLLMIDELSLGLAPVLVGRILDVVRRIHERGTAIILVEQSVNLALSLAQRAYFMEKGEIRFAGPATELLGRPDLVRSVFLKGAATVLGRDGKTRPARRRVAPAEPVLRVEGITKRFGGITACESVSLELRPQQVLGIIGPNGAGKTTLFDCISGFLTPDAGRVLLEGRDVTGIPPEQRALAGLGRSFQHARLFPSLTVAETVAVALDRHLPLKDPVLAAMVHPEVLEAEEQVALRVDDLLDLLGLGGFRDTFVAELSTGTRRIVELACALAHAPKVLLLDEPSAGIAQRETEELGPLLRRVKEALGCSLLVIEHDVPFVSALCDELLAMDLGRVIARGRPAAVTRHPDVVASYLGSSRAAIQRSGALHSPTRRRRPTAGPRAAPRSRTAPARP